MFPWFLFIYFSVFIFFFFNDTATTEIYTLSLHDALPISFLFNSHSTSDQVILLKNPDYYRFDSIGNKLPFLDSVIISFIPDKTAELEAFKKGDIHIIFGLRSEEHTSELQSHWYISYAVFCLKKKKNKKSWKQKLLLNLAWV